MGKEIPVTDLAYAREVVRASLRDQSPDKVEIATLLTDELVANAMEHGAGTPVLTLEVNPYQLRVYVHDEDPTPRDLAPLPIEPTRVRGRGLAIVEALATQWGVEPRHDGKTVWFALDLSSANGAGQPKL